MPLTVIAGLPGSGRSDRIEELVSSTAREGRTAVFVLPSDPDVVRARRSLALRAPVGCRVATLDGVVKAEWALRGDGRGLVRGPQRNMLAARALSAAGVIGDPGRGAVSLLGSLAERWAAEERCGRGRASGLAERVLAAVDGYFTLLEQHLLVEPGEAALLLSRLAPPAEIIVADGFAALEPAEEALLTAWSTGADVTVGLPWSEGVPGTLATEPLVRRLAAAGATIVDLGPPADDRPQELRRIATDLFEGGRPSPGEGCVRLGVVAGDEAEAQIIVRFVSDVLSAGASPERVAVAFADPHRHAGWLRRALEEAGISAGWEVRVPVPETPLGRSLLRLWSFCRHGMHREDLGALLRSPFAGVAEERADRADVDWRRGGIARGDGLLRSVREIRPLIDAGRLLAARPIGVETGKKWKMLADTLLANAHPGMAPVSGSDGALDAAVHRAFCHAVEAAVELGEGEATPDEVMAVFAASRVESPASPSANRITVTSIERVGRREYDHVVLGGLTASELPRRGLGDRIEGEAVGRAMRALHIEADPDEQARAERLAFYLAATSARRTLALVRRGSDDEGRLLRESAFWDEFLDLYRLPGDDLPANGEPRLDVGRPLAVDAVPAAPPSPRGVLTEPLVLSDLAGIEAVSPGEIEVYAACPYRWYVERRLRARAPDVTADVMASGRAAHAALALFYRRWGESEPRVTPQNVDAAQRLAMECARSVVKEAPAPSCLEEQRLLAAIAPSVASLVERDARFLPGFAPAHLEWPFGLDEGDPPVDLGGVLVKGRADRIDVGEAGLIVVDYKRTNAPSLGQIRRDGLVQLQLYAAAASQRLGLPIAGGLYRSLVRADDRGFVLEGTIGDFKPLDVVDRDGLDEVVASAAGVARSAVDGMRAGRIGPAPLKERCAFCTAAEFCPQAVRS